MFHTPCVGRMGTLLRLLLVGMSLAIALSTSNTEDSKKGVHDKQHLSDAEHHVDGDHNADYDHDAFLGKEESKTFDQLSPEESKQRLVIIVRKIDKDNDGNLTEQELRDWVAYVHEKSLWKDTGGIWSTHDGDEDKKLTWPEYLQATYGHLNEKELEDRTDFDFRDRIQRDKRRWDQADQNKDKDLTQEEYHYFLHPAEADHMKDLYILEIWESMDKDKDGSVTIEEYISDIYQPEDDKDSSEEPEWVRTERETFVELRDKNKDGKLDRAEIKQWILPDGYNHIEAEARHLIYKADNNGDGVLTEEEIMNSYEVFVGSQATNFGDALVNHDEL